MFPPFAQAVRKSDPQLSVSHDSQPIVEYNCQLGVRHNYQLGVYYYSELILVWGLRLSCYFLASHGRQPNLQLPKLRTTRTFLSMSETKRSKKSKICFCFRAERGVNFYLLADYSTTNLKSLAGSYQEQFKNKWAVGGGGRPLRAADYSSAISRRKLSRTDQVQVGGLGGVAEGC